mgnify:CR=1 FL=1
MPVRWCSRLRATAIRWQLAVLVCAALPATVLACVTEPPRVTPPPSAAAASADLVAIVRIDEEIPLSPEEQAEFDRLWYTPPANTPFYYPTTRLRFSTLRVLKGAMPEDVLIQNGATSCDVVLQVGMQYVLFAKLPALDGVRLMPLDGTFRLGPDKYDQANLADVERFLSSSLPKMP